MIVTLPSEAVIPVIPFGDPLGLIGYFSVEFYDESTKRIAI